MKSLIAMTLLAGAFLGGYYLGHQDGSPDVFGWAAQAYHRANQVCGLLDAATASGPAAKAPAAPSTPAAAAPSAPQGQSQDQAQNQPLAVIEIGGQLYRIGVQEQ